MEHIEKKIAVLGIGGIGGLVGAVLARHFGEQVSFIARGARGAAIREKGLTLHSDFFGEFTVRPGKTAESPAELPVQDLVLICVKNGGLEQAAQEVRPLIGPETTVIPVMNGVTAAEKLRELLPEAHVPYCVIYTVSMAEADQSIRQQGRFTHLFLGPQKAEDAPFIRKAAALLQEAGLDVRYTEDCLTEVWIKYIWNCAYNVATARWGCSFGAIKHDPERTEEFMCLLAEAEAVARARGIALPQDLTERQRDKFLHTSSAATSSLSRDFEAHRTGEMEMFCGDVVRMGREAGVAVPVTQRYYDALREIVRGWQ